jgi:large subunit ribosomal protein L24
MKLHAGDTVVVITGKDRGKVGRILRILPHENRVVVADINMRTRFIKKTPQGAGRQVRFEASIAASNVMLLDPKTKKPTRIGYRLTGTKERFAKRSGETLASGKKLAKLAEEGLGTKDKGQGTKEKKKRAADSPSASPPSP